MRPLGHQHDAVKAQLRGLVDESIERKKRLAPETGVAHRMKKKRSHAFFSHAVQQRPSFREAEPFALPAAILQPVDSAVHAEW